MKSKICLTYRIYRANRGNMRRVDKHQRPVEQIITEAIYMTDNSTHNCSNHYRM